MVSYAMSCRDQQLLYIRVQLLVSVDVEVVPSALRAITGIATRRRGAVSVFSWSMGGR